jgi:hypothetical protein
VLEAQEVGAGVIMNTVQTIDSTPPPPQHPQHPPPLHNLKGQAPVLVGCSRVVPSYQGDKEKDDIKQGYQSFTDF